MAKGFKDVPQEVWGELETQIVLKGLDYADNFRAYRVSDGLYKKQFLEAVQNGCCGEYESSTVHNGEEWIIGCNHGH